MAVVPGNHGRPGLSVGQSAQGLGISLLWCPDQTGCTGDRASQADLVLLLKAVAAQARQTGTTYTVGVDRYFVVTPTGVTTPSFPGESADDARRRAEVAEQANR